MNTIENNTNYGQNLEEIITPTKFVNKNHIKRTPKIEAQKKQDAHQHPSIYKTSEPIQPLLMNDTEELLKECHTKYPGISRGILADKDPNLYHKLRRRGVLQQIPTKEQLYTEDPLKEYHTNHKGQTRGYISEKYPKLYYRLKKHGVLEQIPLKVVDEEQLKKQLMDEYNEKYSGITRGKLSVFYSPFYSRLTRHGLREQIPTMSKDYKKKTG